VAKIILDFIKNLFGGFFLVGALRERVSIAEGKLADANHKVETLQSENDGLETQLQREQIEHEETKAKLRKLEASHTEEIRFIHDVEFRKSARTGGKWHPFCPKCHLPIADTYEFAHCNDGECGWISHIHYPLVRQRIGELQ
jgi:hypothetical protein